MGSHRTPSPPDGSGPHRLPSLPPQPPYRLKLAGQADMRKALAGSKRVSPKRRGAGSMQP
jgi:hypothetical protein